MVSSKVYVSCGNLFWVNIRKMVTPSVPVNKKSLKLMQQAFFDSGPQKLGLEVVVAVSNQTQKSDGFMKAARSSLLQRISPEEMDHALILHIAQRIRDGATEEELRSWRNVCLSISLRCEKLDNGLQWRQLNLRNAYVATYESCSRSTVQLVFEVINLKRDLNLDNSALAQLWAKNTVATDSELQEKVDTAWVNTAVNVYVKLLGKDACYSIVHELELRYGKSCLFNFMQTLEVLANKTSDTDEMLWLLECIKDVLYTKQFSNKDLSSRKLAGGRGGGARGLLDEWLAKRGMALFLLKHVGEKGLAFDKVQNLDKFRSHSHFRSMCGGLPGSSADLSWQGAIKKRAREMESISAFLARQVAIFSADLDPQLKQALKSCTAPKDIMSKEPFEGMLREIDELIEQLCKKPAAEVAEPPAPVATTATAPLGSSLDTLLGQEHVAGEHGETFEKFFQEATETVDKFVKLIVDHSSVGDFKSVLEHSALASAAVGPESRSLLIYDTKNDQLEGNDTVLVLDGNRYIAPGIMSAFTKVSSGDNMDEKCRQEICIYYQEQTVRARKCSSRGIVDTHETMHVVTCGSLNMPSKERAVYTTGTTMSSTLGPVQVEKYEAAATWKVEESVKSKLLGPAGKVLSGGGLPDAPEKPTLEHNMTVMTFHGMPVPFYEELMHSYQAGVVYHALDVDGACAKAAIKRKTSCVSVVHTEEHRRRLHDHLVHWVWQQFLETGGDLFQVGLP
ncbi:unnamed protein product [Symbiodinium sp. CCMP2592]|nr:unnamed protein product [Symbiodinium sp. CCMP2592]